MTSTSMIDGGQPRGWRALPPPLVLALCMSVVWSISDALDRGRHMPTPYLPASLAVHFGLTLAQQGLVLYGVALLRRRHRGTTRAGLTLLMAALGCELVMGVGWQLLSLHTDVMRWFTLLQIGWAIGPLVFAVGLAVSLWRTRQSAAIVALVAALGLYGMRMVLPGVLMSMFSGDTMQVFFTVFATTWLLHTAVFAWAMAQIAGDAPPPAAAAAARGLRHGYRALQLFGLAMMGTLILGIASDGSDPTGDLLGSIYAIDLLVGAIALAWLGASLVRAAASPGSEVGSYLLGIAGAVILVCGGGMLFMGHAEVRAWWSEGRWEPGATLGVGPVVMLAAIGGAVLAASIARFAGRTGFESLRRIASVAVLGCGVLVFPAWRWIGQVDDLAPHTSMIVAGVALAACLMLGYLCKTAARALDHTSASVPIARVV